MNVTYRFAAGLLAGSLLLGGAGSAFAAGKSQAAAGKLGLAYGQVSGVSTTGFTLTRATKKGQTTAAPSIAVTTTTATKERARKGTTGALANTEYALVLGTKSTTGTATSITALRVIYSAKPFRAGKVAGAIRAHLVHRAAGTVTTSTASGSTAGTLSSLTIQNKAGKTLTFAITSTTHFRVAGKPVTTAPTFTAGERVRVSFTRDAATKTLTARGIAVLAPKATTTSQG